MNIFNKNQFIQYSINPKEAIAKLKKNGLTQKKISEKIGCTQSNISQLIRGKCGHINPSARVTDGLKKLLLEHDLIDEKNEKS